MESFDYVLFTMTSFSAKKSEKKNNIAGWAKKSKSLKWPQKFLNYVLQWCLMGDQKETCIYFWNLHICAKVKEKNEKKDDISLNISKHFETIFDHQFGLFKEHN